MFELFGLSAMALYTLSRLLLEQDELHQVDVVVIEILEVCAHVREGVCTFLIGQLKGGSHSTPSLHITIFLSEVASQ